MSFRALTVGDGDLSFSLALKRAYPEISVTASTLVESSTELYRTYVIAVETSKELREAWNEDVIYGADATKLEDAIPAHKEEEKFDVVLFNHPHLGDATLLESEQRHAERHYALLSHYFLSAKNLLKKGGRVHICLCGNQPKSWRVFAAAELSGLECIAKESTACPIERWLFKDGQTHHELTDVQPHYPTKRKFRNGALGSKHFLAKYGYRHRRTEGDLFDGSVKHINVEQSMNFVFGCSDTCKLQADGAREDANACSICKLSFESREKLSAHLAAPALPDVSLCEKDSTVKVEQKQAASAGAAKKQPTEPATFNPISIEDAVVLVQATVDARFDSKRIKWLCRQDAFFAKFLRSKSQCEAAIKAGRIFINKHVALDSGRIVHEGDIVALVEEYRAAGDNTQQQSEGDKSGVRIVKSIPLQKKDVAIEVVYKPVGIRCVGSFSPNTLEMITKSQVERSRGTKDLSCLPISKMDTGCAGLCVLVVSQSKISAEALHSLKVSYTFTALVHGCPPKEWEKGVYAKVPTEGLRQWKRQKTDDGCDKAKGDKSSPVVASSTEIDLDEALFIRCVDSLQIGEQYISTLMVQSRFDNGRCANVISFVLRKLGHPVVNDRFGKREYTALPQRLRNLVKQKVCIGCYSVNVEYDDDLTTISIDKHKRTQCSFWREILL